MLNGNIFITGCGFLTRGIMRRARLENWLCRITVYSRNEHAQDACRRKYPEASYILGDIRDTDRLSLAVNNHDIIINTAALKYVDIAENNISECLSINIDGTKSIIEAAWRTRTIHTVIGVSTDKAVEPINTYGLSKAVGEKLFFEASRQIADIKFVQTRYGNVIGSTGSVVPLFKRAAELQGEIKLTDPSMTRFWISIDDAVDLIIEAGLTNSGSIVIPHPKAMSLQALAEAVCPGIKQVIIGLRPGERRHEKLLSESESVRACKLEHASLGAVYNYHPSRKLEPGVASFELASNTSNLISVAVFRALADEAINI